MPELPEVENVVRNLTSHLVGQQILDFQCLEKGIKLLGNTSPAEFKIGLNKQTIQKIQRIGKYIIINLSPRNNNLIVHLRMTGRFLYYPNISKQEIIIPKYLIADNFTESPDLYSRIILKLTEGTLYFSDKRRFATFHLVSTPLTYPGISKLGPDALSSTFNLKYFKTKLKKSQRSIYSILLDQTVVAGLGNIYVCEALAFSNIYPGIHANELTSTQIKILHQEITKVLLAAIGDGGTTFSDYKDPQGKSGNFQTQLIAYGKKETILHGIKYQVNKLKIAGRNAYYIPSLQKPFKST